MIQEVTKKNVKLNHSPIRRVYTDRPFDQESKELVYSISALLKRIYNDKAAYKKEKRHADLT